MDPVRRNHGLRGFGNRISHGVGNGFRHHQLLEDAAFNGVSRHVLHAPDSPARIHGHGLPAGLYFGHHFQHKISEIRILHHPAPIFRPERLSGGNHGPKPPLLEIRRHPHHTGIDRVHFTDLLFHLVTEGDPKAAEGCLFFRAGMD